MIIASMMSKSKTSPKVKILTFKDFIKLMMRIKNEVLMNNNSKSS